MSNHQFHQSVRRLIYIAVLFPEIRVYSKCIPEAFADSAMPPCILTQKLLKHFLILIIPPNFVKIMYNICTKFSGQLLLFKFSVSLQRFCVPSISNIFAFVPVFGL
jgi:hypothetical protein